MADRPIKKSKSEAGNRKNSGRTPKNTLKNNQSNEATGTAALSAFQLEDQKVEEYLLSGEHSGILEDYFGPEAYDELCRLAHAAVLKQVRVKNRVLIIPGIMGSKIGRKRKGAKGLNHTIWLDPEEIAAGRLQELRLGDNAVGLTFLETKADNGCAVPYKLPGHGVSKYL